MVLLSTLAGGAALGAGAGAVGSLVQYGLNASAASKSWDKWKDSQTRGPLYQRIGLEKAGFNPALAYGKGMPATAGKAVQAHGVGTGSGGNVLALAQGKLLAAQTETTRLLGLKHQADTDNTGVGTDILRFSLPEKEAISDFFKTAPGKNIARLGRINAASPQTFQAGLVRLANMIGANPKIRALVESAIKSADPETQGILRRILSGQTRKFPVLHRQDSTTGRGASGGW